MIEKRKKESRDILLINDQLKSNSFEYVSCLRIVVFLLNAKEENIITNVKQNIKEKTSN